jgi:hypothetical protein
MECATKPIRYGRFTYAVLRALALCGALAAAVACGGATDATTRPALSGSGGVDSGGSISGATGVGGTRNDASNDSGRVANSGAAGIGTANGGSGGAGTRSDGGACIPLDNGCSQNSDCCSGYCSSYRIGLDTGLPESLICLRPGCSHLDEPCHTDSDCCTNAACKTGICRARGH